MLSPLLANFNYIDLVTVRARLVHGAVVTATDDCDAPEMGFAGEQVNSCAKCHLLFVTSAHTSVPGTTSLNVVERANRIDL